MKNYLLVTEWEAAKVGGTARWDLTRTVDAQGGKAQRLATQYERELNNGLEWNEAAKITIREKKGHFFSVCYESYSIVRGLKHFEKIENSKLYK
jgi:hypothetical protein